MLSDAKACKYYRSRQELSDEYLLSTCNIWRRYSREKYLQFLRIVRFTSQPASQPRTGLSQLAKISQKLEKKLEQTQARGHAPDRGGEAGRGGGGAAGAGGPREGRPDPERERGAGWESWGGEAAGAIERQTSWRVLSMGHRRNW